MPRSHEVTQYSVFGTHRLDIGAVVTSGRSEISDIVIPRQGKDLLVSRRAGRLTAVDGGLLISNESERNSLLMRAIPGPEISELAFCLRAIGCRESEASAAAAEAQDIRRGLG
jgi:hypothetical protein